MVEANQDEISSLVNIPLEKEREIFQALDGLVPGVAIMTKGPKGVVVSDGRIRYNAGVLPEEALVDRTGAGDAFGSGFLIGYLKGGIQEGILMGSANGTSVLEHIGAKEGILRSDQVEEERWKHIPISEENI
jgi:sugar/nucleoside kinase (ribokinase family)